MIPLQVMESEKTTCKKIGAKQIQIRPGNHARLNKLTINTATPVLICWLSSYFSLRGTYILWSLITDELYQWTLSPCLSVWSNSWQKWPQLTRWLLLGVNFRRVPVSLQIQYEKERLMFLKFPVIFFCLYARALFQLSIQLSTIYTI